MLLKSKVSFEKEVLGKATDRPIKIEKIYTEINLSR